MQFSHQVYSHLFIFPMVTNCSFSSLFSSSPSFLHFLSKLSSSLPMAPKAKKFSYVLYFDAFLLTRRSGAVRFMGSWKLLEVSSLSIPCISISSLQSWKLYHLANCHLASNLWFVLPFALVDRQVRPYNSGHRSKFEGYSKFEGPPYWVDFK